MLNQCKNKPVWITYVFIFLILVNAPIFALVDSPWFNQFYPNGQTIADGFMLFVYVSFLLIADKKLFWLILLMTFVSFFAEIGGSFILKIYEYRLHNIPMYIPLGHAVVYATAYYLSYNQLTWAFHQPIEKGLRRIALCISLVSLVFLHDIAGFCCYLLFLVMLSKRKKPLFYLCLFPLVFYLEFLGTSTKAWSYYYVLGNHPYYPPTTITPSGIAGLYMIIDLISNSIYFYFKQIKRQWRKIRWETTNFPANQFS